jgi:hypothetical protein
LCHERPETHSRRYLPRRIIIITAITITAITITAIITVGGIMVIVTVVGTSVSGL